MNELYSNHGRPAASDSDSDPLVGFVRRWWWLLAIGALIGVAVGIYYSRVGPIPYQSEALLQVVPPSGVSSAADAAQTRSAASNFAAEASSPRMLLLVSEALPPEFDLSPGDLDLMEREGSIDISPSRTSNFVEVVVTHEDPDRAQILANTIANVFVADITERSNQANEARQLQLDEQIQFTRERLATAALRQRELDIERELRDQRGLLLELQVSYQQELERQAESDSQTGTTGNSQNQEAVRTQLLETISEQITDVESNVSALNTDLEEVRSELASLPADADSTLSAAFASAYSLQLSELTERYVSDQVSAFTASPPVILFGDASTPLRTQGTKKLAAYGLMGGLAVAGGLGLLLGQVQNWRRRRLEVTHGLAAEGPATFTATPDLDGLLARIDRMGLDTSTNGAPEKSTVQSTDRPPS